MRYTPQQRSELGPTWRHRLRRERAVNRDRPRLGDTARTAATVSASCDVVTVMEEQ